MAEIRIPIQDQRALLEIAQIIQPIAFEKIQELLAHAYKLGHSQGAIDALLTMEPK